MLITEAFKAYADDVIVFKNQSKATEANHYVCMKALLVFFDDVPIENLSFPMVRDWKEALAKTRTSTTVRNYIVRLRVVLAYLEKQGLSVLSPDRIPVPQRDTNVPEFITNEEVSKLIHAVSQKAAGYPPINRFRNAAIIALLYASGIRVSELCAINKNDIREDGTFTVIGKGRKPRLCFLDARAKALIDIYLMEREDNQQALFISIQGNTRISKGTVQGIFRLASRKAGLSCQVHPHTIRHSFATNLLRNNTNMRYVQELLGHASLQTTQMYSHVTNLDLQKIYREHHTI